MRLETVARQRWIPIREPTGVVVPDKDGFAVLEEINFDTRSTRVVVLTASEDDRDVIRIMRLGARGVVLKQSATDLLIRSIQRVYAGEIGH